MYKLVSILCFVLCSSFSFSQNLVTGTVTDENGNSLEEVRVEVKGADVKVHTDKSGNYQIEVPEGYKVLSFHKTGYSVRELSVDKSVVNVVMSSVYVDIFDLTLEELMNIEIAVASKIKLSPRESPGILTVISQEEIANSGARDLIDVLRLVPGFEFGADVEGATSIIMRGNWAHEGKLLLMIDGLELNELAYSTIQLGNHYNLEQIERVEIIRGPGSAIYGGFAELGVINIITKSGDGLNGLSVGGTYGHMSDTYARQNIHLSVGKAFNDDVSFALHTFYGKGNRSDRNYTDIFGDSYNMADNAQLNPMMINFNANIHNLNIRFLYDDYQTTSRDIFTNILLKDYRIDFKTTIAEASYDLKIGEKFTLSPKINYKNTRPWYAFEEPLPNEDPIYMEAIFMERTVERYTGNLTAFYEVNHKVNLLAGAEYYTDIAKDKLGYPFWNNEDRISYNNTGFFAQALIKHDFANLTVGGRFENHSNFDAAFAPRLALTKVMNRLHFKLLFSQAFRSPGVENIDLNAYLNPDFKPDIRPEKLNIAEFEAGYRVSRNMFANINLFYMIIDDPIIYFIDEETGGEGYANVEQTGTKGFEFEYKYIEEWGYLNFNFSYYDTDGINKVPDYEVFDNSFMLLGAPQYKLNFLSHFKIHKGLSVNPSVSFLSERYAYTQYDETIDDAVQESYEPVTLLNLYIRYEDLFAKGLELGLGVYDLLDSQYDFIQPYNGWHAPLPGPSREIFIKLNYHFGF